MKKIFELCKKLGILTFEDLQKFKQENMQENESLEEALSRYLIGLGEGWEIAENNF